MKPNFDGIPQELKDLNQWCLWRLESIPGKDKPSKIPYQINGQKASSTNMATWSPYQSVFDILKKVNAYSGIGFFFSKDDPYCFIDLDNCIEDGNIEQWALDIILELFSYSEISFGDHGIHSIIKATMNGNMRHREGNFEAYDKERYCAITGNRLQGYPIEIQARQTELLHIYNQRFKIVPRETIAVKQDIDNVYGQNNNLSTENLIAKIKTTKNSSKFDNLMAGQWQGDYPSQSEADSALAWIVAFYTHDPSQIESVMRSSMLVREKWDTNKSYLTPTINHAIENVPIGKFFGGVEIDYSNIVTENNTPKVINEKPVEFFKTTDYGNAERLVYYHGDILRYCDPKKTWFVWNGLYWKPDNSLEIDRLAKDTVRKVYIEAGNCKDAKIRDNISAHARKSEANSKIQAMIALAKSEKEAVISVDDLDTNNYLLNCQNGTLDLRTGELLPHNRKDNITKIIPATYDRMAECPRWMQFLDEVFINDRDMIQFIQYALGYSLTGSIQERCMFIAYGNGANGKSKFLDTIEYIMGDYSKHVEPSTFAVKRDEAGNAREDIARLCGARFISSIETSASHRLDEELIKKMTGDRKITTRNLYEKSFEFVQTYKMWLATNNRPIIKGTDDAIWDRIRMIPFERKFLPEEQDVNLYEKLIAEASGILCWIVDGCLLWQKRGLHAVTPEKVMHANEEYRAEMNTVQTFIDDCCVIENKTTITSKELYQLYVEWCLSNGERSESQKMLTTRLLGLKHNIILKRIGEKKITTWFGIGIQS